MTQLRPITGGLWTLLAIHAVLIPIALHVGCGTPRAETLVGHVDAFAAGNQAGDSWRPMAAARAFARDHPGESIYREIFFTRQTKFQYPPTSLLLIGDLQRPALNVLSWIAVCVTVILSVAVFEAAARMQRLAPASVLDRLLRMTAVCGLGFTFYPLMKAYSLGQIQVWIDALFAGLVLAWAYGRHTPAGILLGLICLIKPQFVLLMAWAAVRRQHAAAIAAAVTAAAGLSWSVIVFGLETHLDYLRVLSYIGRRGEAFYPNQSFNGLFNRLLGNGDNLVWRDDAFAPYHAGVYAASLATALLLGVAALRRPRLRDATGGLVDLAVATVTCVIISPIAWEHHFGVLLPIYAATAPVLLAGRIRRAGWLLAVAFILTGQFIFPTQRLSSTWLNVGQSYVLAGTLLLVCMLMSQLQAPTTSSSSRL